jgi:hypothetical protein
MHADVRTTEFAHTTRVNPDAAGVFLLIAQNQHVIAQRRTILDQVALTPFLSGKQRENLRIDHRHAADIEQTGQHAKVSRR